VRTGKDRKLQFLVGQVMKALGGKADPKVVTALLRKAIG
jgi:Asp-tRNA(Asn)/Glu-tRNA(Gln) amidotransferase B subunit